MGVTNATKSGETEAERFLNKVQDNAKEFRRECDAKVRKAKWGVEPEINFFWERLINPRVNPRVELSLEKSEEWRKKAEKEREENRAEFDGMIERNARKLEEGWILFYGRNIPPAIPFPYYRVKGAAVKLNEKYASEIAGEIASERGFRTDEIVDKMIEIRRIVARKDYVNLRDGGNWLIEVLGGGSPASILKVNTLEPVSKTAYSIVGLDEGGLPLKLAAQIGSVNPEVGVKACIILLETKERVYEIKEEQAELKLDERRSLYPRDKEGRRINW
jgi:hypothetical protein